VRGTGTMDFSGLRAYYTDLSTEDGGWSTTVLTGAFVRKSYSMALNPAKTFSHMQVLFLSSVAAANTIYADRLMIARGVNPPQYFDGATTDTASAAFAWTGATDASTSTMTTLSGYARIRNNFELRPY
jgi:hypothetical protein